MQYLSLRDGIRILREAIASSVGAADADKIVATNSEGVIDPTLISPQLKFLSETTIATTDITLTSQSLRIQYIDPNGQNRDVILPVGTAVIGKVFVIKHIGASRRLTVDGNIRLRRNQVVWVHYDGTLWRQIG